MATKSKKKTASKKTASKKTAAKRGARPKLLAGGNPQIAKGDGAAPVRAYIAAIPGWKRGVGERIDRLVTRAVPKAKKAVKWNSPFYGVEGQGWFLSFHCFTKYVKVTFFNGASLSPLPPGKSSQAKVRYLDVHEDDALDEKLVTSWIRQAAALVDGVRKYAKTWFRLDQRYRKFIHHARQSGQASLLQTLSQQVENLYTKHEYSEKDFDHCF